MQQTYQNQGQGQFYPQQQQQQYQQQQFQQVPNQVQYQVPPPQQVIQGPVLTSGGGGPIADLESFRAKYEIKPSYIPVLQKLALYRSILICDDSGSMNEVADPDSNSHITRWDELQ